MTCPSWHIQRRALSLSRVVLSADVHEMAVLVHLPFLEILDDEIVGAPLQRRLERRFVDGFDGHVEVDLGLFDVGQPFGWGAVGEQNKVTLGLQAHAHIVQERAHVLLDVRAAHDGIERPLHRR